MESTEEQSGLLHRILPPRLEDAGLEDPALPPASIHEAFLKAAAAVKSSAASIFSGKEDDDDCLNDPWPTNKGTSSDAVIGIETENNPPGSCTVEKGIKIVTDDVRVGGGDDELEKVVDELVVGEEVKLGEDGDACVDGFQGLDIKEKEDLKKIIKEDEEEKEKKPILAEGYV